ncbi:hypothetical protein ABEB36_004775 [Hypothenemus hampei]|uniref:Uncharacterized protein n=1 Tax=Hypothenemus hampei TaxID=57062 RepID=A0ABD1EVT0_HYPHA
MRKARAKPSPFEAEMSAQILEDWDTALEPLCLKTPKLKGSTFSIQKYVKLIFKPSGVISAYQDYNGSAQNFKIFKPNAIICDKEQLGVKKLPPIGLNDDKKKDLISLMGYLTPVNRQFYSNVFENCNVINSNNTLNDDSD